MKLWGRLVKNAKEHLLDFKKDRLLTHWENKKYDKMVKAMKTQVDYDALKINDFPFLYFLINEGDAEAIKAVLEKVPYKENIINDDNNPMGVTPIAFAFLEDKQDIVQLFQEHNSNLSKPNSAMQNILHTAAIYKREEAFNKAVTNQKVDINLADQFGNTPFHYAARAGSVAMVATMVAAKAKKVGNQFHQYPIHMAIESGVLECVDALVDDIKGHYPKYSPIHSACRSGNSKLVQKVLDLKPATLNSQDYKGLTPLHHAVLMEDIGAATLLLEQQGILIDRQDEYGNSPIHLAFINESLQLAKLLIERGADLDIVNEDQMSPVDYGIQSSNKALRSVLLSVSNSEKVKQLSKNKY